MTISIAAYPSPTPTPTPIPGPAFYVAPNGSPSGNGSITNPWDLQTALTRTLPGSAIINLRGGTYNGKFTSTLAGVIGNPIIVRSFPGQWAKIDSYRTTTLTASITASSTSIPVADVSGFNDDNQTLDVVIDNEVIRIFGRTANSLTVYGRGLSGGGPPAAHSAGALLSLAGRNLVVLGSNTTYRDFELTSSDPVRDATVLVACGWGRGDGVAVSAGSGNKLINLVVHDTLDGIVTGGTSSNTTVYGCVVYNNGIKSSGEGLGHGMYLENASGYSQIYSNIVLNNFNMGVQAYGVTAAYSGGDWQDNVFANSGSPLNNGAGNRNALIGPERQRMPSINIVRNHFVHRQSSGAYGLIIGYGAGVNSATFNNNYIIGGTQAMLVVDNSTNITGSGNQFYGANPSPGGYLIDRLASLSSWNNNTYHNGVGDRYAVGGTVYTFPAWKTATGFDATSTATSIAMPDRVIVVPNIYTAGRANVYIYSISGATSANIDLSPTGLTNGQAYEIRNAQNYFGSTIATGTYNSGSPIISVSLTGVAASVAAPVGLGFTPVSTCPEFCPMVVVPR